MAHYIGKIKMKKGEQYLRNRNTGQVFVYEAMLAEVGHMERFVYDGSDPATRRVPAYVPPVDAAGKAEEFNRLASMTTEQREVEKAAQQAYLEEQKALAAGGGKPEPEDKPEPGTLVLTDKATTTLEEYSKAGWSEQQLIDAGIAARA